MRHPNSIELHVNKSKLTKEQLSYLESNENIDFEYNSKTKEYTLWIHNDGNFQMTHEILENLIPMLGALKGCVNNETGTDHLNLFIEAVEIDEFGIEVNNKKYKNIKASELETVDLSKILLKRELNEEVKFLN